MDMKPDLVMDVVARLTQDGLFLMLIVVPIAVVLAWVVADK